MSFINPDLQEKNAFTRFGPSALP